MDNKYIEEYSDVNVEGIEFYVKEEADGYLYKEAECENKVTAEELTHAFEMNDVVIVDGDYKYRPEIFGLSYQIIYNKVTITTVEEVETITLVPTKVIGYVEPESEETVEGE